MSAGAAGAGFARALAVLAVAAAPLGAAPVLQEYELPPGSHPHDVAPAADGGVWYTAQHAGALERLDPATGSIRQIPLGRGSRPHGVILASDRAPWVTDGGLNALVRVDPQTEQISRYPLPEGTGYANLNTAAFDRRGRLWFTGQSGIYGSLDPASGEMHVYDAPRGYGPYGIAAAPDGYVYYASLAGSYLGRIDPASGRVEALKPPGAGPGTRRVWPDSRGVLWITGWSSGNLLSYDPSTGAWSGRALPGTRPRPYAVFVDQRDTVWVSDFTANAILSYDPEEGKFTPYPLPSPGAAVRQMLGRPGELWGAESGTDKLVVIRYGGEP